MDRRTRLVVEHVPGDEPIAISNSSLAQRLGIARGGAGHQVSSVMPASSPRPLPIGLGASGHILVPCGGVQRRARTLLSAGER